MVKFANMEISPEGKGNSLWSQFQSTLYGTKYVESDSLYTEKNIPTAGAGMLNGCIMRWW